MAFASAAGAFCIQIPLHSIMLVKMPWWLQENATPAIQPNTQQVNHVHTNYLAFGKSK